MVVQSLDNHNSRYSHDSSHLSNNNVSDNNENHSFVTLILKFKNEMLKKFDHSIKVHAMVLISASPQSSAHQSLDSESSRLFTVIAMDPSVEPTDSDNGLRFLINVCPFFLPL